MFCNNFALIIVAFLWGATNPFIRRGTSNINKIKADTTHRQIFQEIKYLATNWQYLLPFLLNQSGSVLYFFALQCTELSLAVPIANSLSFVFTAIVAILLGEEKGNWNTYLGVICVMIGTSICMYDKIYAT